MSTTGIGKADWVEQVFRGDQPFSLTPKFRIFTTYPSGCVEEVYGTHELEIGEWIWAGG